MAGMVGRVMGQQEDVDSEDGRLEAHKVLIWAMARNEIPRIYMNLHEFTRYFLQIVG